MNDNSIIREEKAKLLSLVNEKEEKIAREKVAKEALNKKIAVCCLAKYLLYVLIHYRRILN